MVQDERAKVLIVDDLAENLLSYETILEELGQELVFARSGDEALKEVLRHDFAVILLDVNMPGMDGLETAQLIRRRKRSAHTPIIFVTAFADDVRVTEGYAHGAVDYISNPVVPNILRAKVQVFVDLYRMTAQIRRHAEERVTLAQERAKREAAEESNRRLTFLARSGALITRSLDQTVTIESILRILVPEHAGEAVLVEQDETGAWQTVWGQSDGGGARLVRPETYDALPESWRQSIARVMQTTSIDHVQPAAAQTGAGPELLALPMRDRERLFAVLLLVRHHPHGSCSPADVAMFESLTWRAGIALVNARLYAQIERADQQKNRFLSMLAHELRNPLAPIRSAVDVLRLCGDSPTDIDWARDVIDRQVNHLIRLVDDLLDVSRITLGKIRLQIEPLEATEIVTAAVEISQPLIDKSQHQLTVELPDEPLHLSGDRARLTQVLANLLNNAAKYTPPGGRITVSLQSEDDQAVFRVRDSGIGIPPHMLDKVFDMFIQVENSLDRSQGGLGIGLTLVRELIAMHQGTISATSEGHGCGSEFVIAVPCAPESRDSAGAIAHHNSIVAET